MACDPCDECDSIVFEPTVSFKFINQDSIKHINDSLRVFAFNDSSLQKNIDSLRNLRDSLITINDSIAAGGNLQAEQMDLERWIEARVADSSIYAPLTEDADSLSSVLNQAKATISSGLIEVEQIAVIGTGFIDDYNEVDSDILWKVPLSYTQSFDQYEVTFEGIVETIILDYDLYDSLDENRNLLRRAQNIRVVEGQYVEIDSVNTNCGTNCTDAEAVFTFYY